MMRTTTVLVMIKPILLIQRFSLLVVKARSGLINSQIAKSTKPTPKAPRRMLDSLKTINSYTAFPSNGMGWQMVDR